MKRTWILVGVILSITILSCEKNEGTENFSDKSGTFTDNRDNQTYTWVKIGRGKIWMAENLNYDAGEGSWVYNNEPAYASVYGRLYDWETACAACPDGWHLPSDPEWTALANYLGGGYVAGGILKESDTVHWQNPNTDGTDLIGFTALPGGYRSYYSGYYYAIGRRAFFWSSTELRGYYALFRLLTFDSPSLLRVETGDKVSGYSVRCIKDYDICDFCLK